VTLVISFYKSKFSNPGMICHCEMLDQLVFGITQLSRIIPPGVI